MDERVWLHHPESGGYFGCPAAAVDDWLSIGWERSDPPPPKPSPVVAENLAWRKRQAADQTSKSTNKAARRGTEGVGNG